MKRERSSRFCLWCDKSMKRKDRIEMGIDATRGKIAVCSIRCMLAYNFKRWPTGEELSEAIYGKGGGK